MRLIEELRRDAERLSALSSQFEMGRIGLFPYRRRLAKHQSPSIDFRCEIFVDGLYVVPLAEAIQEIEKMLAAVNEQHDAASGAFSRRLFEMPLYLRSLFINSDITPALAWYIDIAELLLRLIDLQPKPINDQFNEGFQVKYGLLLELFDLYEQLQYWKYRKNDLNMIKGCAAYLMKSGIEFLPISRDHHTEELFCSYITGLADEAEAEAARRSIEKAERLMLQEEADA